jgi:hypothetical protein
MSPKPSNQELRAEIAAASSAWSGPNERTASVDAALVRVIRALDEVALHHAGRRPKKVELVVETAGDSTLEFKIGSKSRWTFEGGSWVDDGRQHRARLLRPVIRGVARASRPDFVAALDALVRDIEVAAAGRIAIDVEHEPTDPPVPGQSIAELLESVFPALSSPDRARLLGLTHMLELAAGTTMFIEGAEGDQLLFLLGGTVAVETVDGLVRLRPGSVVGERAPLARRPRDATVRAITDVVVLELYARDLGRLPAPVRDVLHAKVV